MMLDRESKQALLCLLVRFPTGRLGWSRLPLTAWAALWILLDRRGPADPGVVLCRWGWHELWVGPDCFEIRPLPITFDEGPGE